MADWKLALRAGKEASGRHGDLKTRFAGNRREMALGAGTSRNGECASQWNNAVVV